MHAPEDPEDGHEAEAGERLHHLGGGHTKGAGREEQCGYRGGRGVGEPGWGGVGTACGRDLRASPPPGRNAEGLGGAGGVGVGGRGVGEGGRVGGRHVRPSDGPRACVWAACLPGHEDQALRTLQVTPRQQSGPSGAPR
jgi:hypothetical protein